MAITDTSVATMLFVKQDRSLPELKAQNTRALKNKEAAKTDETKPNDPRETQRDKAASFKAVLEKEIKKQFPAKKPKGHSLNEDLKKKKNIRPFYVVPKNKQKNDSLPVKTDKKPLEAWSGKLAGGNIGAQLFARLMDHRRPANELKLAKAGNTAAGALKQKVLKNTQTGRQEKNKALSEGPKLIVVDLREKPPAPRLKSDHKLKHESKKSESKAVKASESLMENKDMKLFVKHTSISDNMLNLKSDFETRHMPAKQPLPQFTQLQKALSAELVKQTRLIVKNGGNGEIRLVLKPESLGHVRVRVNIHDNNIVGKIFVDNNTVKEMVQGSLSNLYNAFKQDGFNQAMINVFVGSEKGGSRDDRQEAGNAAYGDAAEDLWESEHEQRQEVSSVDSLVNILL